MTNQTDEDVKASDLETEISLDDDDIYSDPMFAGLKEAEKELEGSETEGEKTQQAQSQPAAQATEKTDKGDSPMIPKPRFDEIRSERDLLRSQVAYMQGLEDARAAKAAGIGNQDTGNGQGDGKKDGSVDDMVAAIEAAEQRKLELAEKYDEGELSTRDWKAAELVIDKEIRGLTEKREIERLDAIRESSKVETDAMLNAQRAAEWLTEQTISIQQDHPNVAVIDATPEHIRNGIWQQISSQALQNLSNQGINVNDPSPNTKFAIIKEKARLTDSYTADSLKAFLPPSFVAPASKSGQRQAPVQNQLSERAKNRSDKLDLADSLPPQISDMRSSAGDGELTESDLEGMTEDQIADLIKTQPQRIQRALGINSI